jgi:integrase
MPENRLVVEIMLRYGLRVSDVLNLRRDCLDKVNFTIYESKTGKRRRLRFPAELRKRLLDVSGDVWVFPSPVNPAKHRTRQAVWTDIKRASKAMRIHENIGPHSARKSYACELYMKTRDIESVRLALNHDNLATTLIYLLDILHI